MMLSCGHSEIGHWLGLPTQAYISLSDAKQLDAQAGLETAMGATMAVLSGINQVSGPGMLELENCQSLEKLVVDNEICGTLARLSQGIVAREDFPALPIFQELLQEQHLVIADHTRKYLAQEYRIPGPVIDRSSLTRWTEKGSSTLLDRARGEVEKLLKDYVPSRLSSETKQDLMQRMGSSVRKAGLSGLPGVD